MLRRCRLALMLGLAVAVPALAAPPPAAPILLPGVGAVDPRVAVDTALEPWRGVGRVQTNISGRCTGFLVGPSLVLTAAHCLYNPRTRAFLQPGSVHFLTGYDRGSYVGHSLVRALAVGPGYDPTREDETRGADWAVLQLAQPLGTPDRILALAGTDDAWEPTRLTLGGYGQDRAEVLEADPACALSGWARDGNGRPLLRHTCSGTRGTSGAPLLARAGGRWVVVGLQVAAVPGQATGVAVPAAALRQIDWRTLGRVPPA